VFFLAILAEALSSSLGGNARRRYYAPFDIPSPVAAAVYLNGE